MSVLIYPFNYHDFSKNYAILKIGSIKNALEILRKRSFYLSKTKQLAVAIFFSKIMEIPEVKEIDYSMNDKTLVIFTYIEQPNYEAEEKIYEAYGQLLDLFPTLDIDMKVVELYGRSIEELKISKF